MIKIFNTAKKEEGSAIIFAVMGSLITLALAFILMASTTQNLNVAYFNNNDIKLTSAAETGTSTAISLINSGYDFTQHDAANPYIRERTILSGAEYKTVEKISWHVEPFNIAGDTLCTDNAGLYTPGEVEVLLIGGGGSGGGSYGAGGGSGGYVETTLALQPGEHDITVGAGGAAASVEEAGNAGGDSSAFELTAIGGGGGAAVKSDDTVMSPLLGGSGGGATISSTSTTQQTGALGTPGQGTSGGDSTLTFSNNSAAAGGGGATSKGSDGQTNIGGNGGNGVTSNITGTSTSYAAGGGGSAPAGETAGAGGSNIGGDGGTGSNNGSDGQANTGSGGGGSYSLTAGTSGAGADGIVVVRYPTEINGYSIPVLATGGTVSEITVGATTYNVHTFTNAGTSTFNLITTGALKHNCGYELHVTAEMPLYSDEAKLTTKTILTPMQYSTATAANSIITYQPTQTSLFRNGIHANGNLTIEDGVNLYAHYSKDSYNNTYNSLSSAASLNAASLGSGEKITIDSTTVSQSDIMNATLHHVSGTNPSSYVHAECEYNSGDCTANIINELNFKISETAHLNWIEEQCADPLTSFSSTQTIPAGVTCVDTSAITLATNPVEGTYENPSILIVKGNLTFDTDTALNPYRPSRTLQIYATGNIDNNTGVDSISTVNALIAATGTEGNISFEELNATSTFTLNGATYSSGNTNYNGNITIWQDLNAKFIRNINDKTLYQRNITETESYVRESFNISNMGGVFGDTWNPDTSASNVTTGAGE